MIMNDGKGGGEKGEKVSKEEEPFMCLYLLGPHLKGQLEALGMYMPWPPPSILFASFNL